MSGRREEAGRSEVGAGGRGLSFGEPSAFAGDHSPWFPFHLLRFSPRPGHTDKVTGLVRGRDQLKVYLMPRPLLSYQPIQPLSKLSLPLHAPPNPPPNPRQTTPPTGGKGHHLPYSKCRSSRELPCHSQGKEGSLGGHEKWHSLFINKNIKLPEIVYMAKRGHQK